MLSTSVSPAVGLAVYLEQADLVAATTPTAPHSVIKERVIDRSYSGAVTWPDGVSAPTAASADVSTVIGAARVEDNIISQIESLSSLQEGWDGEQAAAPNYDSARAAIKFIHVALESASLFEPTLHSDGSLMLEVDGGIGGSIRFNDDGSVSYALMGHAPATVMFDGKTIPNGLKEALKS